MNKDCAKCEKYRHVLDDLERVMDRRMASLKQLMYDKASLKRNLEAAKKKNSELVAMLKKVEKNLRTKNHNSVCLFCFRNIRDIGRHAKDCKLAALIKEG